MACKWLGPRVPVHAGVLIAVKSRNPRGFERAENLQVFSPRRGNEMLSNILWISAHKERNIAALTVQIPPKGWPECGSSQPLHCMWLPSIEVAERQDNMADPGTRAFCLAFPDCHAGGNAARRPAWVPRHCTPCRRVSLRMLRRTLPGSSKPPWRPFSGGPQGLAVPQGSQATRLHP